LFLLAVVFTLSMWGVMLLLPIDKIPIPINVYTKIGIFCIFMFTIIGIGASLFRIMGMNFNER
jgi:hypothetical protein